METNTKWILGIALVLGLIVVFIAGGVVGALAYKAFAPAEQVSRTPDDFMPGMGIRNFQTGMTIISEVFPDSPADGAGLEAGDAVFEIDGESIQPGDDFAELIGAYKPGDEIVLTVQHAGTDEQVEVSVTLGEHPDDPERAYLGVSYAPNAAFHMQLLGPRGRNPSWIPMPHMDELLKGYELNPEHFQFLDGCNQTDRGAETGACGLIVVQVAAGSPAEAAGIQVGDLIQTVNGEEVLTQEGFVEQIRLFEPGDTLTLTIYRLDDDETLEIEVLLGSHPDEDGQAYLGITVPGFFQKIVPEPQFFQGGPQFHFFDPQAAPDLSTESSVIG
jgi:predicted metalloprotease with PDZ domain